IIMVNVIPPYHVDDVPVVEPNQHDDVPVIPEPVLVDKDEDPEEDEFKEEDDMEVDIEEDENEPELAYPYEEMDPLNPPPLVSESEPEDVIEVENPIEHEDETVPASVHEVGESSTAPFLCEDSDGLLHGLMRRDINSLFGQMASLSRRLCGRETAHALVEKKGKAKDEYHGKLILDLGNEVRSSVEQGTAAMEKLVENLGTAKDKGECQRLKKELEEARIMPPKSAPLTQDAIRQMIKENVDTTIAAERARHANVGNDARGSGPARGAVELLRWFEKTESVFGISKCVEGKKTVNQMPWTEMKQLMTAEFCLIEEVQRMEHELWNLKVKEYNIVAYTQRFNKLALMCSRMVEPERVKNSQKQGNAGAMVTAPTDGKLPLCERCFTCHVGQCTIKCGKVGHKIRKIKQEEVEEARGRAYAIKDAEPKGPNVETGTFMLNNRCAFILFDSGSDRSFADTRFSSMLNIDPVKIGASYEVELADGRVASTNTFLKCCTLNLVNHVFEIDLMPIELGTFDVIIGMDWLIKHDAMIVCGEKVVRIPYGNKILIVESDKGVSRLKVISCIKARKYVKRGCHLFLAYVTENKSKKKRLEDVPVIHDFPEVFPEELPGLPPPRQVEF
ncbi:putative reverse transcriptase domain-containing protein, partial [Tanacetum coccineum]